MTNRVILGAFGGTYVLRVSKPGYDVLNTGLTTSQLAFDSRWSQTCPIVLAGLVSVPAGNVNVDVFYPFNLGFYPVVLSWAYVNSTTLQNSGVTYPYAGPSVFTDRLRFSSSSACTMGYIVCGTQV